TTSRSPGPTEVALQPLREFHERQAVHRAHRSELNDVETGVAALDLADLRLCDAEGTGQFDLRHARLRADILKQPENGRVLARVDRFLHPALAPSWAGW